MLECKWIEWRKLCLNGLKRKKYLEKRIKMLERAPIVTVNYIEAKTGKNGIEYGKKVA